MAAAPPAKKDDDKSKRSIGKYNIYETLGKGGYSWVKKGEDTETGAIVALKFMNRATDQWALEQAEQVRTEIKSLTQIRHEHVMKLYAYNLSAKYPLNEGGFVKTILLVLEYCPGGELFDILYYADKLEEEIARTYFKQMIEGVQAVHKAGIAHRDLKPQNLLLDTNFSLKITDFGLSKIIEKEEDRIMKTTYVGTRGYQAPELLKNQKYTNACDIFSMGVILFILLAGYPPFEAAHKTDKWYRPLATGNHDKFWHVHRGAKIDDAAKEIIQGMLSYRPSKRWTLDQIIKTKWYSGDTVKKSELKEKVLNRFLQARQNRKKDAKKTKDLVESNHKAERKRELGDEQKKILKKMKSHTPPKATDDVKNSMRTFFAAHTGLETLMHLDNLVNGVLMGGQMESNHDLKNNPWELKVKCKAQLNKKDGSEEMTFEFRVSAHTDKKELHSLIHIQPVLIPDRLHWHRLYRDIIEDIAKYDIFVQDAIPVLLANMGKKLDEDDAKEEESKEDEPMPVRAAA